MKAKQRKALYLKLAEGFANNTLRTHGICNVLRKKIRAHDGYDWVNEVLSQFDDQDRAYNINSIEKHQHKNNPLRATIMLLAAAMID